MGLLYFKFSTKTRDELSAPCKRSDVRVENSPNKAIVCFTRSFFILLFSAHRVGIDTFDASYLKSTAVATLIQCTNELWQEELQGVRDAMLAERSFGAGMDEQHSRSQRSFGSAPYCTATILNSRHNQIFVMVNVDDDAVAASSMPMPANRLIFRYRDKRRYEGEVESQSLSLPRT